MAGEWVQHNLHFLGLCDEEVFGIDSNEQRSKVVQIQRLDQQSQSIQFYFLGVTFLVQVGFRKVVGDGRFELPTSCVSCMRSNQLS